MSDTDSKPYSLSDDCRKHGYPTSITNPYDFPPRKWAEWAKSSGATPVDFMGDTVRKEVPKPPLGLMPRHVWDYKRGTAIMHAIIRYEDAGMTPPEEWFDELRILLGAAK
jgi:hypothetical protein